MIAAGVFALVALFAIIAVDVGLVYLAKRKAQGANDIAAEMAAQDIAHAEAVVRRALAKNGITAIKSLAVTSGIYKRDASIDPKLRFTAAGTPPNAVHVVLHSEAELGFARFLYPAGKLDFTVASVGAAHPEAAFSIGSRLLSVNGGILNAFLNATLGTNVSLTALDYNALVSTQVNLFGFLDALATRLNLTAGTYDEVLAAEVSPSDLLHAATSAIAAGQDARGTSALASLAAGAGTHATLHASDIILLQDAGERRVDSSIGGLSASFSALSLVSAIATIANGNHQLTLSSGISLPGIAGVNVDVWVGERPQSSPWLSVGDEGAIVRTAQVRAALRVTVGGTGLLSLVSLKLPVVAEVAQAEARLTAIDCSNRAQPSVDIAARPGILGGWIGETTPFALDAYVHGSGVVKPAVILNARGIKVTGKADFQMAAMADQSLSFDWNDITNHTAKTVTTRDYTRSLVASLIDGLDLKLTVVGIPLLPLNAVLGAVLSTISPLTGTLDGALNAILSIAGANLGQADIWVNGARCESGLVG